LTVGFILIEALVALLLHKKVPPEILGVAVNVAVFPSQMVWLFTVTVAKGLTVTVPVAVFDVQPAPDK
jgi:hypothetical protein